RFIASRSGASRKSGRISAAKLKVMCSRPSNLAERRGSSRIVFPPLSEVKTKLKSPDWPVGALLHFEHSWRGGHDFGLRAAAARVGLARREIFHWRLAPFPFTGRGWKLRSSSQRRTRCLGKRRLDSIRIYGMSPRFA